MKLIVVFFTLLPYSLFGQNFFYCNDIIVKQDTLISDLKSIAIEKSICETDGHLIHGVSTYLTGDADSYFRYYYRRKKLAKVKIWNFEWGANSAIGTNQKIVVIKFRNGRRIINCKKGIELDINYLNFIVQESIN